MTAVSLLDAVTRDDQPLAVHARAVELAGQLVDVSLSERRRISQLEADFAPVDGGDDQAAMEIERSIYSLYQEWAAEAEQVLVRIRRLLASGFDVKDAEAMENAYASTLSRLKFTPERTARGIEQARRGQFVPAEDLRNELRSRIRS
jgi:predicted transcriptional regulator